MKRSNSLRSSRMADLIQQELSRLLVEEVQDPRLDLVTISGVRLNTDLRIAEVLYTAHDPEAQKQAGKALAKAGGFLRSQLGKRLTLRYLPELRFVADTYLEDMIYARPHGDDTENP